MINVDPSLGINVDQDTLEVTREYKKYLKLIENGHWIPRKKRKYYEGVESDYLSSLKGDQDALNRVTTAIDQANEYKQEILQYVD